MPWIVVSLVIGLVAVAVGLTAVLVFRRRASEARPEMTGDQLFTLGIVFTGAGVALAVTIGPAMLGIMALGIAYMTMGAWMKRQEENDEHRSVP